jgi:single-stranded-DNA-specific exonuclease
LCLRPAKAPGKEHELKGSGRSIPGFHLRDALDLVVKRHPGVLLRFGGHAMAAGCTLEEEQLAIFEQAFGQVAQEWLDAATLQRCLQTDGPLAPEYRRTDLDGHPAPRGLGTRLCAARVQRGGGRGVATAGGREALWRSSCGTRAKPVDGIWFGHTEPLPARVKLAFRLDADEWQGVRRVRFLVEGAEL